MFANISTRKFIYMIAPLVALMAFAFTTASAAQDNNVKYKNVFDAQAKAAGLSDCNFIGTWSGTGSDVDQYQCYQNGPPDRGQQNVFSNRGNIMFFDYKTDVTYTWPGSGRSDYMLINTTSDASNVGCPNRVYFIDQTGTQPIAYRFGIKNACSTVADEAFYDPDGRPLPTNAELAAGYHRPKLTVEQNRKYNGDVQWGKKTIILTMAGGFPFVYDRATHKFVSLPDLSHGPTPGLDQAYDIYGTPYSTAKLTELVNGFKPFADKVYPKPATSAPPAKP